MLRPRKLARLRLLVFASACLLCFIYSIETLRRARQLVSHVDAYNGSLANRTLGFNEIIAVSAENISSPIAWRQRGLMAAAKLTGLQINVQNQPKSIPLSWWANLPPADHGDFEGSRLPIGSALSMLGHVTALERVVEQRLTTALLLEDDVDWDVRLREQLKPEGPIAEAIRAFDLGDARPSVSEAPYGLDWDILWIGNCNYEVSDRTEASYADDLTARDPSKVRGMWSHTHFADFPLGKRGVFLGATSVGSFAYAVTLLGAQRILSALAFNETIDNSFYNRCRDGELRCIIVSPELLHHQRAFPQDSVRSALDFGVKLQGPERWWTMNIEYSARCNSDYELGYIKSDSKGALVKCLPTEEEFVKEPF